MSICAAYPLTKERLKGRSVFMLLIVFTMFFSGGIIPEYLLVKQFGMLDSLFAFIVPGMISAFNLIILRTFFSSVPASLEESAYLDGSSHIGTLIRIVLPLSTAGACDAEPVLCGIQMERLHGCALLHYTCGFISNPAEAVPNRHEQHGDGFNGSGGGVSSRVVPEGIKAASIMFATTPILIVYPWLQRYFVSGVMIGAVKG